jgi:hypothetical protein
MKVRNVMVNDVGLWRGSSSGFLARLNGPLVVALCAVLLIQPTLGAAQEPAQIAQASTPSANEISSSQPVEELPSAPIPQAPGQPQTQNQPQAQQTQPSQQPQTQQPNQQTQQTQQPNAPRQPPVGTAAAPYEKPTGVPGSRPAGAAIAPAKQRRVRAIVISLAVVLAGAGAIGAVAGMSKASHSQP